LLTLLRAATEDEMIAAFVRAELESPRFGAELCSALAKLGMSVEVVSAATSVAGANEARRQLLAAYRGWGQYESVFGGMPDDVVWSWAELDESILRERVFTIKWYFEQTFGTRSAHEIGEMKRRAADASRSQLERSVAEGRLLEPPILLAEPDLRRLVILEGHSRILSYMANPDLVTFPILSLVGTSARVAEWSEW
jgi:hypothetical protein